MIVEREKFNLSETDSSSIILQKPPMQTYGEMLQELWRKLKKENTSGVLT